MKKSGRISIEFEEPIVTLFDNVCSPKTTKKGPLRKLLFTDKFKELVETYRNTNDEKEKEKIKKSLPCFTPSGAFFERTITPIAAHSSLICIDIDAKDNPIIDLPNSKHLIGEHCPSLYYAGLSIGGKGIFLIFRISNPELHRQHFYALKSDLKKLFGLNVENAVKSINSLRVVSYDDNPYYNSNPIPYEKIIDMENKAGNVLRTISEKDEIREKVKRAMKIIQEKKIDITKGYINWFKIGCALAHEFGEEMREWFHIISFFNEDYYHSDCDIQYSKCIQYKEESGIKIGTFFWYCDKYGIEWRK